MFLFFFLSLTLVHERMNSVCTVKPYASSFVSKSLRIRFVLTFKGIVEGSFYIFVYLGIQPNLVMH